MIEKLPAERDAATVQMFNELSREREVAIIQMFDKLNREREDGVAQISIECKDIANMTFIVVHS